MPAVGERKRSGRGAYPAPFWESSDERTARLWEGDAKAVLPWLGPSSVHMVATSPPYWGQRDYGGDGREVGTEADADQYARRLANIFNSLRAVLRDDGTVWLNLGDTRRGGELCGLPWLVARHLQDNGWLLLQEVIWEKPSGMPESAERRLSCSHEQVFFFAKTSAWWFDKEALREHGQRTVWRIPHDGYGGSHFATFPPALIRPMVLASTSQAGVCGDCGKPWERVVEKERRPTRPGRSTKVEGADGERLDGKRTGNRDPLRHVTTVTTVGWEPGCRCDTKTAPVPATVLDPFCGSGAAICAALAEGRRGWGIDLSRQALKDCAVPRIEGAMLSRPELSRLVPARGKPALLGESIG